MSDSAWYAYAFEQNTQERELRIKLHSQPHNQSYLYTVKLPNNEQIQGIAPFNLWQQTQLAEVRTEIEAEILLDVGVRQRRFDNGTVYTVHDRVIPDEQDSTRNRACEEPIEGVFTHPGSKILLVEPVHLPHQRYPEHDVEYEGDYMFQRDFFSENYQSYAFPSKEVIYIKKGKFYLAKLTYEEWRRDNWFVGFKIVSYNKNCKILFNTSHARIIGHVQWPDGIYRKISSHEYHRQPRHVEYWEKLDIAPNNNQRIYQVIIEDNEPSIRAELLLKKGVRQSMLSTFACSSLLTTLKIKPSFYSDILHNSLLKRLLQEGGQNWRNLREVEILSHDSRQSMNFINQYLCAQYSTRINPPQLDNICFAKFRSALREPEQSKVMRRIRIEEAEHGEQFKYRTAINKFFEIHNFVLQAVFNQPLPLLQKALIEVIETDKIDIKRLAQLRVLRISDPFISGFSVFQSITQLTHLQKLSLGALHFDGREDNLVKALTRLYHLRSLSLSLAWRQPEIEEKNIRNFLSNMSQISNLNVDFALFREAATFDTISQLTRLEKLSLKRGNLTSDLIKPLISMTFLTSLSFAENPTLGDDAVYPFIFRMAFTDPSVREKIKLYQAEKIFCTEEEANRLYASKSNQPYVFAKCAEERSGRATTRTTTLTSCNLRPYQPWIRIRRLNLDNTGLRNQESIEVLRQLTKLEKLSLNRNQINEENILREFRNLSFFAFEENRYIPFNSQNLVKVKLNLSTLAKNIRTYLPYDVLKNLESRGLIRDSFTLIGDPASLDNNEVSVSSLLKILKALNLFSKQRMFSLLNLPSHVILHIECSKSTLEDGQLEDLQELELEGVKITANEEKEKDFYKI